MTLSEAQDCLKSKAKVSRFNYPIQGILKSVSKNGVEARIWYDDGFKATELISLLEKELA